MASKRAIPPPGADPPPASRGWRRWRVIGIAVACVAAAGVLIGGDVHPLAGPVVRAPPGCDPLPAREVTPPAQRIDGEVPAETARTVVDIAATQRIDPRTAYAQIRDLVGSYDLTHDALLPTTGLRVQVFSDGPIDVDVDALDRLVAAPLVHRDAYGDARIASLFDCYARRVLDERELAASRLRLVVPSDPRLCFQAARLLPAEDVVGRVCDAHGVAIPELRLRPGLLGLDIASLHSPATITVAPGLPAVASDLEHAVALVLVHELVHHYDNAFGVLPWSGGLRAYEQRAEYVQRALRRHEGTAGYRLPRAIRFVATPPSPAPE